jgi:FkbM family methyltransferase
MKLVKSRPFSNRVTQLLNGIINLLENNNNLDFDKNGENFLLTYILKKFSEKTHITFFDVGANEGTYSKKIIDGIDLINPKYSYQLHLFEPTQHSYNNLLNIFSNNQLVKLNKIGLSNDSGKQTIFYDKEGSQLASLINRDLSFYDKNFNSSEEISVMRLDTYIRENNISHINLLKIDVEGVELRVLEGLGEFLTPDFVDFIQFEYGGTNLDSKTSLYDFYILLESKGFRIAKLLPKSLWVRNYQPSMDNFQYSNYLAFSK